ncbi:Nudix hydrolase domain-containing protein [Fusarium keratoplasticum]|uniref:Nudix hydrolase domain-containing protein n=1 Tax=Fusarium keratoplasticum TaxID=1328300 RepID=A0ACC0R8R3_9HYPO|nr:Nudix hydrolase domain-containing protein [Fusarium keratoplasticum]KAI8675356.1 Nudix hydrolase domain-containing protein [Fusarium keratoplasticum]KAI8681801.1 Nudix hydrolase domain-containing protein [Fusarium keratoplasticum]
MASTGKSLHFSNQFVISCGTVSLDVERSKVLLIRWRRTGEYSLPKGRKDIDEPLEETALRETFEETGIRVQLLPVSIDSLATLPSSVKTEDRPKAVIEPIAVTQRTTRQGILKIIFWYVATADSTTVPEEGTQQENEDFDTIWADFDNVGSTLSFDDDRSIAEAAIAAIRRGVAPVS